MIDPFKLFHSYQEPQSGAQTEAAESANGAEDTAMTNGDVNLMEENSNPVPDSESINLFGNR